MHEKSTISLWNARSGRTVSLVEMRTGAVAMGNTTAKLSILQGIHFSQGPGVHAEKVRPDVGAARVWVRDFCSHGDLVHPQPASPAPRTTISNLRHRHPRENGIRIGGRVPAVGCSDLAYQSPDDGQMVQSLRASMFDEACFYWHWLQSVARGSAWSRALPMGWSQSSQLPYRRWAMR